MWIGRSLCRTERSQGECNLSELRGEKIDIINWDENPAYLIENALSPAKVIFVAADEDAREAQVIVPDYQLSLRLVKKDRMRDWQPG